MTNLEKQIACHRKALEELQRQKAKSRRPKKAKSTRPKGRPRVEVKKIEQARTLAQNMPLPDVAMKLEIALSTLYAYNIKRKILNKEKEAISECDSPSELSPGLITD